jgi:type VI secretion system protein ImpG
MRLYERLVANVIGIVVTPVSEADDSIAASATATASASPHPNDVGSDSRREGRAEPAWRFELPADSISTEGFEDDEALLPGTSRTFSGYRLLQEYFGLASRYMFIQLSGLASCLATSADTQIDIMFLLNVSDPLLERSLNASHFALHCTPAINLFSRRIDRLSIKAGQHEHHVVVDRTRPIDFEIHTIETVAGYRTGQSEAISVAPLFEAHDDGADHGADRSARTMGGAGHTAGHDQDSFYYQLRRERRLVSPRAPSRRDAIRSGYVGSEAFIALTGGKQTPMDDTQGVLHQLAIRALCTNRDLPLSMPLGSGATDFSFDGEAPLWSIRCVGGVSPPTASIATGATAWRLLNHLSLNYASLVNSDASHGADKDANGVANKGAEALREMLSLYCAPHDPVAARQVEGVRSVSTQMVSRRVATKGPLTFGRGMEVTVVLDDAAFEGGSAFLMGAVLARFFTQYVSVNAFVETVVRTLSRGEIMRWSPRSGQCPTL